MKIALLTISDENFREIADRTFPSMRRYADAFGLEFLPRPIALSDRPTSWGKILQVREVLRSGFDYCFYVDADTMFVRFDADIRDSISAGKDLHLCWHCADNSESYAAIPGHFNAGVAVWRNSAWSFGFLDEIWRQTEFIHHPWWEQAATLHLLGYRALLGGIDAPDQRYASHVARLPIDWNALVGYSAAPDPILRHFAGRPSARRMVELDRELALQPVREMLPADARRVLSGQLNLMSHQSQHAESAIAQAAEDLEHAREQTALAQGEARVALEQMSRAQAQAEEAVRQQSAAQGAAREAERQMTLAQASAKDAERQRDSAQARASEAERQMEQIRLDREALLRSPAKLARSLLRAARNTLRNRD
ncbi:MAG: hypothetical protein QOG38_2536 [Hyphomicrobiales bacterium]|nr:hypothetical protein [Hyphomicrobiales bacterium]